MSIKYAFLYLQSAFQVLNLLTNMVSLTDFALMSTHQMYLH